MSPFEHIICNTFGFTSEEYQKIASFFEPFSLQKGDFFLKEGQACYRLGFVQKGILREFLYTNEKEVTKWFSSEGYFATDISGYLFEHASKVNYEAVTAVEMMVLSKENYDKIGDFIPRWSLLEKSFLVKCFNVLEQRVIGHLSMNSEERYNQMYQFNPQLFNEVPLHQIASMLGITPETLSRIRKKQSQSTS